MVSFLKIKEPFTHDLTGLKEIESFGGSLTLLRIGVVGSIAMLVWQGFNVGSIALDFVIYGLLTLCQTLMVTLLPRTVGRAGATALFASCFMIGMAWARGLVHLWLEPAFEMRMLALIGLFWWMIYAVTARRSDPVMMAATTCAIAVTLLMLPFVSWNVLGQNGEALLLIVTSVAGFCFFLQGIHDVRLTRDALRHAQIEAVDRARIEALGRLTGGVAHDFNNLLTVISGNLELINEIDDREEQAVLLQEAAFAAGRAAQVTGQLLTYSRRATLRPSLIQLDDSIAPLKVLLDRLLPAGVTVDFHIEQALPPLMVDRSGFETVLLNLCLNARDAMLQGGHITVLGLAHRVEANGGWALPSGDLPAGRYLRISVTDTGVGMPPEVLERICEPYYTTKPHGQGAGLGLAMAKGFAEQSGGSLLIESVPGQGTRASLILPAAEAMADGDPRDMAAMFADA